MDPDDEQRGPGDDPGDSAPGEDREEESAAAPWLHPDDRLWRHPSEVRGNPPVPTPKSSATVGWAKSTSARMWLVAATSGLVGALVSVGLLWAAGAVGTPQTVYRPIDRATAQLPDPTTSTVPSNLVGLLAMVEPSIVGVTVNGSSGVENGSGVIVETGPSGESYLVTDSSLFADAGPSSQVQVTTNWGHTQNASLVGTDAGSGIALLKAALPSDVSTANIGSVANIQTGEQVFSVGSLPMATNESNFAPGYINDTMSYIQPVNGASNAWYSMLVANMSVVTPDYGGAVVDSSGNVLGITNPGAPDDLSYVTPIDTIMAELSGMIKDGQAGAFPWLGVLQATDMSGPAAQSLGVEGAVQVESVASGSPVAKVGVQDNDVITTLDGRSLPSVGALIEWLANAKPGQVMSIGWLHAGRRHAGSITLGSQPTSANPS